MTTLATQEFSANERELAVLLDETTELKTLLSASLEKLAALQKELSARLSDPSFQKPEEDLEDLTGQIEDLKTECVEYLQRIHNHGHDLQGMRECDDVSCESFFEAEHLQLKKNVQEFLIRISQLKISL